MAFDVTVVKNYKVQYPTCAKPCALLIKQLDGENIYEIQGVKPTRYVIVDVDGDQVLIAGGVFAPEAYQDFLETFDEFLNMVNFG